MTVNGIIANIKNAKNDKYYTGSFTVRDLNSLIYNLRRTKKEDMSNTDKFGKPLAIGDTIIVCFSKHGKLSKATILGEKEKVWKIKVEYSYGTQDRTMDKNPERIIKYD